MILTKTISNLVKVSIFIVCIVATLSTQAQTDRIIRFEYEDDIKYGLLQDSQIKIIKGDIFQNKSYRFVKNTVSLNEVKLLPPVSPSKIVAFGWTFKAHAEEVGGDTDIDQPLVFLKPPSCLIAHNDTILYPEHLSEQVEFEGEIAIIIGRKGKFIPEDKALDYVFGYSCFNDVTARDLSRTDPQFTRAKGFDTFGPIGPWIVTGLDYRDFHITTRLNGEVKQDASVNLMRFSIPYLISYISQVMTLEPGDIILTGTPGGTVPVKPGDTIEVEIKNIGVLRNKVN